MLGWFHALMPKEDRFFDLFAQHSRTLVAGAQALSSLLHDGDGAIERHCQDIMEQEQAADRITRDVLIAVRRTFITPFDRGDIKNLITAMDDAIDEMQRTAKTITLFEVRSFTDDMVAMGDAVVECAGLIEQAMPLLARISTNAQRLGSIAEQVSQIEGRADDLHDAGLKRLFANHKAPDEMSFIIGSSLYEHLESVVDSFDDVANEINSIVIEHV